MHPDVEELRDSFERAIGHLAEQVEQLSDRRSPDALAAALATAIRQVRDEPATEAKFLEWSKRFHYDPATTEATFNGFTTHARRGFFAWLGERMFLFLSTAAIAGVLAWALTTGKFTK